MHFMRHLKKITWNTTNITFFHSPWPFPSLLLLTDDEQWTFLDISLSQNEIQSVYTDEHWKSCLPPMKPAWRPMSLGSIHPEAGADTLHPDSVLRTAACQKQASTLLFKSTQERPPLLFFFNKKEFQAIPHIPSLKTPLRYTRHGQRSLMVSIIRHNVCAVLVDTEYNVTKEGQSQRMPAIKGSLSMFPIELHQHACEWQS